MNTAKMQLTDWLDDLSVRFIVNLPREELESVERICFQVEEAQWFYEDFVRPLNPNLPSLTLRQFSMKIFQHCPLFSGYGADMHSKAFSEFLAYKTRVPVRGAILLNETLDHVILVKGWKKGANWSFPRGKINKDEKDIDCAIREVYEETGFDVRAAGLAGNEEEAKYIEVTMREQHMKLFVFSGVPMSTHFEPRTRKEISKIQWYKLSDLPTLRKTRQQQQQQQGTNAPDTTNQANKFYMVAPFLNPLRKIISSLKRGRPVIEVGEPDNFIQADPDPVHIQPRDSSLGIAQSENDMIRLMAQLRQSQQASRETDLPEVSSPAPPAAMAKSAAQSMLAHMHEDRSHPLTRHADAARRESKASAMLSLLRGENDVQRSLQGRQPPQTPFEQILPLPSEPPPSPKQHASRTTHYAGHQPPPGFPFAPNPSNTAGRDPRIADPSYQSQHRAHSTKPMNARSQASSVAPYRQTGDPGFAQTSYSNDSGVPSVPPASKLPPPKLTQHSSTLLDLFKSSTDRKLAGTASPTTASARPELSVASPSAIDQPQSSYTAFNNGNPPLSSTPALATPDSSSQKSAPKQSSQQEALLSIFRQPKPSPSLVPPDVPVELSAQGSPTQGRLASAENPRDIPSKTLQNGKVTIQKRPTHASGVTSATVTGPVNVPQFDKILKRDDSKKRQAVDTARPAEPQKTQHPIKILPRPNTTATIAKEPMSLGKGARAAKHSTKSTASTTAQSSKRTATDFHPQILKRPENVPSTDAMASPMTIALNTAPSLESPTPQTVEGSPIADRRSSQSTEQRSALLALFGKPQGSAVSPVPIRTTTVVSPLSERPPIGSELPSPLGLSRSRLGSLQEGGVSGKEPNRSGGASPGDKKFLLGFLDGVVKERRK